MTVRVSPWLALLFTACLGIAPPAPAPRLFDPVPSFAAAPPVGRALAPPRVTAEPQLGQSFVLRIGPRELQFDDLHRWSALPERLVAQALERGLFGSGAFSADAVDGPRVHVLRFELDLQELPQAVVVLQLSVRGLVRECTGKAPAGSRNPAVMAEAMAVALHDAVLQVAAALRP